VIWFLCLFDLFFFIFNVDDAGSRTLRELDDVSVLQEMPLSRFDHLLVNLGAVSAA
jgi:hypothetical protein